MLSIVELTGESEITSTEVIDHCRQREMKVRINGQMKTPMTKVIDRRLIFEMLKNGIKLTKKN